MYYKSFYRGDTHRRRKDILLYFNTFRFSAISLSGSHQLKFFFSYSLIIFVDKVKIKNQGNFVRSLKRKRFMRRKENIP